MPTEKEFQDMLFGWYVESGVSSNSALFIKDEAAVAIGTGDRTSVEIAVFKAYTKYLDGLVFKKFGVPYAVFKLEAEKGSRKWKTWLKSKHIQRNKKAALRVPLF